MTSQAERHLSGEQDTWQEAESSASSGQRAGCSADPERAAGHEHRVVGPAGCNRSAECGGRPGQAAGSRPRSRGAADWDRRGAASRRGFPGGAGPPARRWGRPADHSGAGRVVYDRGRAGSRAYSGPVADSGDGPGGHDRTDVVPCARAAGDGADRGRSRSTWMPPTWRSTAQEARGGLTIRASRSAART
jgi:hypothetical protein